MCAGAYHSMCEVTEQLYGVVSSRPWWAASKVDLAILLSSGNYRGVRQPSPVCVVCGCVYVLNHACVMSGFVCLSEGACGGQQRLCDSSGWGQVA